VEHDLDTVVLVEQGVVVLALLAGRFAVGKLE